LETQLRSPVFRPLCSPYLIEQCCACTVLPPLEWFLRDERGTGPAQPFVCRNLFVDRFGSLADIPQRKSPCPLYPQERTFRGMFECVLSANGGHARATAYLLRTSNKLFPLCVV
jgi:hypothetical protein